MTRKKFFQDKRGKTVILQAPNRWAWLAAVGYVTFRSFEDSGHIDYAGLILLYGAGGYWAYLELASGDSPWRRTLGALAALVLVLSLLKRIING